jgi:hypothetical protein
MCRTSIGSPANERSIDTASRPPGPGPTLVPLSTIGRGLWPVALDRDTGLAREREQRRHEAGRRRHGEQVAAGQVGGRPHLDRRATAGHRRRAEIAIPDEGQTALAIVFGQQRGRHRTHG